MSFPWNPYLNETERRVIENGKYGQSRGLGERPVLLIIDLQHNYVGADEPITEQQDRWPAGGGADAWAALRKVVPLAAAFRSAGCPVMYTRNVQKKTTEFDGVSAKAGWDHSSTVEGHIGAEIVTDVAPADRDLVIDKSYASAFYGTPLLSYLISLRCDTLVIAGVSTSGCVRATAVDAAMRGFRLGVVHDAVADRIQLSHAATLLDLWMKYADLLSSDEAIEYVSTKRG